MQCILNKGAQIETRLTISRQELRILPRVLWHCIVRASPQRAWLTLSLVVETALRRPRALRNAVAFALMHKHLYGYMRDTCKQIDRLVQELKQFPDELRLLPESLAAPEVAWNVEHDA